MVVEPSQNAMVGWSPDGKYLLFTSDRTGSRAFANDLPRLAAPALAMMQDLAGKLGAGAHGPQHGEFGAVVVP